jgi:hypothetical protein
VHAVAGEALDRAGVDFHANDMFVHYPTVANTSASPCLAGGGVSAR